LVPGFDSGQGSPGAVDDYGGWAAVAREGAQFDGNEITLDVPPASAALITLLAG
jgi:hypothetical protein